MPLPIAAGTYGIDTAHSQLGFAITHLGISVVRGTFDSYTGSLTVGADLDSTSVEIDADTASVNSSHPGRDDAIRSEMFFDAANHPTMTFRSSAVSTNGDGYELAGDLTIRGITQPITLDVVFNGEAVFPMDGSTHFGFSATGQISRSAFGIDFGVPMVTDAVDLNLEVQFIRPA